MQVLWNDWKKLTLLCWLKSNVHSVALEKVEQKNHIAMENGEDGW